MMAFLPLCVILLCLIHMRTGECKASGTDASSPRDPDVADAGFLLTTAHYLDMRERLDQVDNKISDTDKHLTRDLTEISGKLALLEEKIENLELGAKLENMEMKIRLEMKDQFASFLDQRKRFEFPVPTGGVTTPPSENNSLILEPGTAWARDRLDNVSSKIDKVDGALVVLQSRLDDNLYTLSQKSDVCVRTLLDMRNESRAEDDSNNLQGAAAEAWITVLRRMDGRVNFTRGWDDYKAGFGDLRGEFWLGLEDIHQLTAVRAYRLRVVLTDFSGEVKFAEYARFYIRGEPDNYRLHVSGYVAGSTARDSLGYHNDVEFSTYDRDHDQASGNCAVSNKGSWWYKSCHNSQLTGQYQGAGVKDCKGVNWQHAYNDCRSFKRVEMSIRPYV